MKPLPLSLCLLLAIGTSVTSAETNQSSSTPAPVSQGTPISTYGIIAKNLIGFLASYSATHDGSTPTSWADMEKDGLKLDQFERSYGISLPEIYSFVSTSEVVPEFNRGRPIIMHNTPVDYRAKGTNGRYVIWHGENGRYEFSRLPEDEIQHLITKYKIVLSSRHTIVPPMLAIDAKTAEQDIKTGETPTDPKSDSSGPSSSSLSKSATADNTHHIWWALGTAFLLIVASIVSVRLRKRTN